jgi:hypothetical protein
LQERLKILRTLWDFRAPLLHRLAVVGLSLGNITEALSHRAGTPARPRRFMSHLRAGTGRVSA